MADLARALPSDKNFESLYRRVREFLRHSVFEVRTVYGQIVARMVETRSRLDEKQSIPVILDWTDYGRFHCLQLALAYKRRAIPLAGQIVRQELREGSETSMELDLLKEFLESVPPEVRSRVVILADRGFAKVELLKLIAQSYGAKFAIRSKRDHYVFVQDVWKRLEDLGLAPGEKRILRDARYTKEHEFLLHVAIRRLRAGEPNDDTDDTWFILTNLDPAEHALWGYEKRFWIEEMFRDFKNTRNGFHFEQHQIQSEEIFEKLLLVLSLTYLMILEEGQYRLDRMDLLQILPKRKPPKRLRSGQLYLSVFQLSWHALRKLLVDAPDEVWENLRQMWSLVEA